VFEVLGGLLLQMRLVTQSLDVSALDGEDAKRLVEVSSELERLAAGVRTLAAGRVAATGAWIGDGDHRDAGAWMASVTGTTVGRARATIETATRLTGLPKVAKALRAGSLSEQQVEVIASAATANPRAEASLLRTAETEGVKGLKTAAARIEAAASRDQDERYRNGITRRFLRHRRLSDVEGLIEMRGPIDRTARVMAALEPIEHVLFEAARAATPEDGPRELPEARAFDALVRMADDSARVAMLTDGRRAPATVVVRVDKAAFERGATADGELCEIAGVGPIPVSVAQELSADALLRSLITDGTAVLAVSNPGRTVPARLRVALEELQPECVIAGCHVDRHLEIDHNRPFALGGRTELANLNRLCHHHHRVKTQRDLRVVGEGLQKRLVPADRAPPGSRTP
jgi:hypothetical protein